MATMVGRMRRAIHRHPAVKRFRDRRYQRFVTTVGLRPSDRIIDVGAGLGDALESRNDVNPITAVDVTDSSRAFATRSNVTFVVSDARALPFPSRGFDVAFSNSVIEHILGDEDRERAAAEIRRVADRYWVQTPNRWFPIEPHYMVPLYQFLPRGVRRRYDRRRGNRIELLTAEELRRLFPDAEILRERFLGLTKSLVAVRRAS